MAHTLKINVISPVKCKKCFNVVKMFPQTLLELIVDVFPRQFYHNLMCSSRSNITDLFACLHCVQFNTCVDH